MTPLGYTRSRLDRKCWYYVLDSDVRYTIRRFFWKVPMMVEIRLFQNVGERWFGCDLLP